jgi:glycosyltransferase involved in cell wall biosynthesis
MTERHLLVVTYYYPPQPGSGSNRWAALVKYLRRIGHDVTVLTAAPPGYQPGVADGTIRTGNLNSSPFLRRLFLRSEGDMGASHSGATSSGVMPPVLWKLIVPEPWLVTWNPYAWRALRRQLSARPIDCVITSSPADSTHLLGLALGRGRPAWIADFRDGWCFEPLRPPFPTRMQKALDRSLERRVATSADAVVGVTAPIADYFRERLGVDSLHIPNGFDPEVGFDGALPAEYDARKVTLVHTGQLIGPSGRDPRPLLAALRALREQSPELFERMQLLVAGRSEFDELAILEEADLVGVVRYIGHVPREQALALQKAARALVLLTSPATGEATGKIYEYMASGRPIIALAHGNEAARIVMETGTGTVVPPGDVPAIMAALQSAISGELEQRYAPHDRERYLYPAPARAMETAIETAIEARRRQRRDARSR